MLFSEEQRVRLDSLYAKAGLSNEERKELKQLQDDEWRSRTIAVGAVARLLPSFLCRIAHTGGSRWRVVSTPVP